MLSPPNVKNMGSAIYQHHIWTFNKNIFIQESTLKFSVNGKIEYTRKFIFNFFTC